MSGPRRQESRDAITVEISYAVASGCAVAALLFLVVASPALFLDLGRGAESALFTCATLLAAAGFTLRAVTLLIRLRRAQDESADPR
ncbi:DUF6332 family protein [Streptomyces syringium]|uniref:DUF6332 family protein n=1 Tax=Streptomyces TaxID=1883 RepID=UPI00351323C4